MLTMELRKRPAGPVFLPLAAPPASRRYWGATPPSRPPAPRYATLGLAAAPGEERRRWEAAPEAPQGALEVAWYR